MEFYNLGVPEYLFKIACDYARDMMPEAGFTGDNWEAPPFDPAQARVEVHEGVPKFGLAFRVRIVQRGERYNTSSQSGRVTYPAEFTFMDEWLKG